VAAPDGTEFQHACEVSRFPNHSGSDEGNTQMNEHRAEGRISIDQLLGKICICLPDQKVNMAVGQLLVLDCGMVHNVEALEESAFLLTVAWPKSSSGS
jgi:quercetin dioxygenase-like cupin family protein